MKFSSIILAGAIGSGFVSAAVAPRNPADTTQQGSRPTTVSPSLPWPTPSKPHCNSKCTPIVRKSWRKMTKSEKSKYITAVKCISNPKLAKSISGIAGAKNIFDDFQGTHSQQTPTIHWVGHFVLWHRYFVAAYEKALRTKCGYTGAQPFWDWEYDNASGLDMTKWDIFNPTTGFGGNGPYVDGANPFNIPERSGGGCVPNGPFTYPGFSVNIGPGESTGYNPRCLTRDFSRPLMKWGNQAGINAVWNTSDYGWFTRLLEMVPSFNVPNIHGGGHFGPGGALGTIGDANNSPGDPIFYLHHANIDRIFWQWQWQKKNLPKSLTELSGPIVPFDYNNEQAGNITANFKINIGKLAGNVSVSELLNTQGGFLCYTYAKP